MERLLQCQQRSAALGVIPANVGMPVPDQIFNALFGDLRQALLAEAGKFSRQAPALSSVGVKPFTT
jgi:hypothetical protein